MINEKPKPSSIPDEPGSYIFRDGAQRVIYVGKAKSLRSRLSSYFTNELQLPVKTQAMLQTAASVEWIQVGSEVEALILEYNLIKQHRPRYNVRLRDDKSYPYLAITTSERWPRAIVTRGMQRKGDKYFGPYPHTRAIRETLDLLTKTFPLRSCSNTKFQRHEKMGKPCLAYHIDRCLGPCVGKVEEKEYRETVAGLARVLRGDSDWIVQRLESEMRQAASDLEFETAARVRDRLSSLRTAVERQEIVSAQTDNFDLLGYYEDELESFGQLILVRRGKVVGRASAVLDKVEPLSSEEVVESLLRSLYEEVVSEVPSTIFVPALPHEMQVVQSWLTEKRAGKVEFKIPKRGQKLSLMDMAQKNAKIEFDRSRARRATDHNTRSEALVELQSALGLKQAPLRIECYDMSHLQGTNYVGSMVVMEDGLLKRSDYRRFKVSSPKNDDYGAMEEVLRRRLKREKERLGENENIEGAPSTIKRFAYPPNLIVVDGGKGQLNVAVRVVAELGMTDQVELASLAKEFEEIYVPGKEEPIRLSRSSQALFLVKLLRDEAHRFAITFHRLLRAKSLKRISLDEIPGLGEKRKELLLAQVGSAAKVLSATDAEIDSWTFLPSKVRSEIKEQVHNRR
ncbi:Excinuclease ABC subunit C [Ferrithrix thermotolerans DSM 19514]|uniref:UvrABC system protein C n=1 Tax=Ferrithrix thermotolerans DSM 19514 TaxID=1121881 RepID=A0A1M4SCC6_9ACTN|nr:excinuclease ABC subunit UvrC [Ferrithrix thermotolerans]SHE29874.1 Excinuclease ABC subunit C [Ferrithrix thermotolerans DSM 19514]